MFQLKRLKSKAVAAKIAVFLTSRDAFQQELFQTEIEFIKRNVFESINDESHAYWYVTDRDKIVGAGGVRETDYKSGGYIMSEDYFAVHKDYRTNGIGTMILGEIEKYVKEKKGRFLLVATSDIDLYKPARNFYEKHGYRKVGHIPDYYYKGEGRIDYFKSFTKS